MQEKLKTNRLLLTSLLSVVAMAMTVGSVINCLDLRLNSVNILNFLANTSIIVAGMIVLLFVLIKKEFTLKQLFIPLFLYYAIQCANDFESLVDDNWASAYYLALDAAIIVLSFLFIFLNIKKVRYALYLVMIIEALFIVASVLGGSAYAIGSLLISVIFIGNIYMLDNKEEEKE